MAYGHHFNHRCKTGLQTYLMPLLMVAVLFLCVESLNCVLLFFFLPAVESLQTAHLMNRSIAFFRTSWHFTAPTN